MELTTHHQLLARLRMNVAVGTLPNMHSQGTQGKLHLHLQEHLNFLWGGLHFLFWLAV